MADKIVIIVLRPEFREEDADGTECTICKEVGYLPQNRLFFTSSRGDVRTGHVLCYGCSDEKDEFLKVNFGE